MAEVVTSFMIQQTEIGEFFELACTCHFCRITNCCELNKTTLFVNDKSEIIWRFFRTRNRLRSSYDLVKLHVLLEFSELNTSQNKSLIPESYFQILDLFQIRVDFGNF